MSKRARLTALSTSASSKIRRGDFPTNSSETYFKLMLAAACIISWPTSIEPVKLTCTHIKHKNQNISRG